MKFFYSFGPMPILRYEILHLQQIKSPSISHIKHYNTYRSKKHIYLLLLAMCSSHWISPLFLFRRAYLNNRFLFVSKRQSWFRILSRSFSEVRWAKHCDSCFLDDIVSLGIGKTPFTFCLSLTAILLDVEFFVMFGHDHN